MRERFDARRPLSLTASVIFSLAALAGTTAASAQTATDLVCSACVQASDLAADSVINSKIGNGAVTAAKLAAGAATNAKIANNAVTAAKLTTASVTEEKIANNAVNQLKIANAAVTGPKIAAGAVNQTKVADNAVTTAMLLDGAVTADKLASDAFYARTLIVSVVGDGSDTAANGQVLLDALAEAGAASPAPDASNPWLIKIEPGVYDVGTSPVVMVPYVDVEGSGQGVTSIEGAIGDIEGLVRMASNSELRQVTVRNEGTGTWHYAVTANSPNQSTDWRISDVTAIGMGGTGFSIGIMLFDIAGSCDGGVLTNVTAMGSGPAGGRGLAVLCDGGTVTGTNVTATSSGGTESLGILKRFSSTAVLRDSSFAGDDNAVQVNASGGTLKIISSEVNGSVSNSATLKCVGAYDAAGDALDAGCL